MRASEKVYVEALRVTTRPALVTAAGHAALAVLVGMALLLSVWKGLPVTASVIASGGLVLCVAQRRRRRQPTLTAPMPDRRPPDLPGEILGDSNDRTTKR